MIFRFKVEALWFKCFIVFLENLVLGTFRIVTSQNLVPAKFYKKFIQSTELSCKSGIL